MLLPNAPLETIQSGETSEVSIYSGTKVVFDGSFQDENGAAYNGAVQVSMFHLTPSDENIDKLMPGMLYAQTQNNEEAVLETFGMLNVELRGSAGQKLNIATGHTAEITIRIDDSQQATAPSTIPLWHFDEAKGYWKEDGVATKVGNKYVGEVSHFSWWNCDAFASTVSLTITVVDVNGNYVSDIGVSLNYEGSPFSRTNITNSNGQAAGIIPMNRVLTLTIYDVCVGIIYTSQIGPFSQNTNLAQIELSNSVQVTKVSGSLFKCDNTIVTNGYVLLENGNASLISELDEGNYNFTTLTCSASNTFAIEGFNFDNNQSTGKINHTFSFPETNVGVMMACSNITEFISYTYGDEHYIIVDNFTSQEWLGSPLWGNDGQPVLFEITGNYGTPLGIPAIGIFATNTNLGNYTLDNSRVFFRYNNGESFREFRQESFYLVSSYDLKINKFGAIGDYVDISFSGKFNNEQSPFENRELQIIAHIRRDH